MTHSDEDRSDPASNPENDPAEDESTGLPGFRSWTAVYLFVGGVFIADVVLLKLLSRLFG